MESRNLEDASESGTALQSERRRVPRLSLTSELFRLSENGRVYSVVDFSTEGFAIHLLDSQDLVHFTMGRSVKGTFSFLDHKYQVRAKVRNLRPDLVGFEFDAEMEDLTKLRQSLDPARLGQEIKRIPASDPVSQWYRGASGVDLLFWGEGDDLNRFLITFFGSFVEWTRGEGVRTGRARPSSGPKNSCETRGIVRIESLDLTADPKPVSLTISAVKLLLKNSTLPPDLVTRCSSLL